MRGALERVGEGRAAPGYLLLQLLSEQGWAIDVIADDSPCDWQPTPNRDLRRCSRCGGLLHLAFVRGAPPTPPCPESGVLVRASKFAHRTVEERGKSVADVAVDVVKEAVGDGS